MTHEKADVTKIVNDSGDEFLRLLAVVSHTDVQALIAAQKSYGNSWKQRGGVGAFMMLARKWDRLENRLKKPRTGTDTYDIFHHVIADTRAEGVIDDIRDLRRYLMLVEAELLACGHELGIDRDTIEAHREKPEGNYGRP